MINDNNNTNEISKVKIGDQTYDIKDAELREMIRKFIGDLKQESETRKEEDSKIQG